MIKEIYQVRVFSHAGRSQNKIIKKTDGKRYYGSQQTCDKYPPQQIYKVDALRFTNFYFVKEKERNKKQIKQKSRGFLVEAYLHII